MNGFRPQYSTIKGLSEKRRLPRIGRVRLGIKGKSKRTGNEYPIETPYFVVDSEVAKVFGEKPTELRIMLPVNDSAVIFPQRLTWWGGSKGLKCVGDGNTATRIEEPDGTRYKDMLSRDCPCELLDNDNPKLKCARNAALMFMIPEVSLGGVFQISLGSINSIIDINSGLDFVTALIGRFAMVPLVLKRTPRETHPEGKAKQIHYTLQLLFSGNVDLVNSLRENSSRVIMATQQYALPAPELTNPSMDEGATVVEVEDAEIVDTTTGEITGGPAIPENEDAEPPTAEQVKADLERLGMIPGNGTTSLDTLKVEIDAIMDAQKLLKFMAEKRKTVKPEDMPMFTGWVNARLAAITKK